MTLGGKLVESPDRLIVPFWNWSSISLESNDRRFVLNETEDSQYDDVNCSDFVPTP